MIRHLLWRVHVGLTVDDASQQQWAAPSCQLWIAKWRYVHRGRRGTGSKQPRNLIFSSVCSCWTNYWPRLNHLIK